MDRKSEWKFLFLVVAIFISACVETDIYLPAFPDMMQWFSASESEIQSLLTWNFYGICLAGPLYGPLSDAFGRKKPLMTALSIFLVGSILTFFADSFAAMLVGRVLQGIGSGGCFTLGTAIIFDAFQKERAVIATSHLNTIIPILMSGAPILGGYLNSAFGFRSNFLAVALLVLLSWAIGLFCFKETLPKEKRTKMEVGSLIRDFRQAFSNVAFWQITLSICLIFGAYIAFLSGTSVLFTVEFGLSKTVFPLLQTATLGAWVVGGLLLKRVSSRWGAENTKKAGLALCMSGAVFLSVTSLLFPKDPYLLTGGMLLYAFGGNWVIGLYFPEGMEILPHIKGVTASLMTSARLLSAALIVGVASFFYNSTIYPLSIIIVATAVLLLPTLVLYEKGKEKRPYTE